MSFSCLITLERIFKFTNPVFICLDSERKFEQRAREYLLDEEDEDDEDDMAKQVAQMKATGKVVLDGVEYKVEPATTPSRLCPTPPSYNVTPPSYCGSSG